ncbi:MAG: putative secreted glycosyl hydrolase [Bacteroidetes bacterium]|nr:MAG: putative secreted glycosyl hydrolase [Bacteroidota bacterium]
MKKIILFSLLALAVVSCANAEKKTSEDKAEAKAEVVVDNGLSAEEVAAGWMLMFDGTTPGKWRGYGKDHFPTGWKIENGTLQCIGSGRGEAGSLEGGDIIFDEKFQNFELSLEWKISSGGNSGILYLAQELPDKTIWQTAPEMQVLDNTKHPDGRNGVHSAGALYDMIGVAADKVKPVGEWNQVRLLIYKGLVEHWLNGEKVVEYHLWTPEWNEMVAKSKFPQYNPDWANVAQEGFIGLQDHGDDVWYKNIKIRKL